MSRASREPRWPRRTTRSSRAHAGRRGESILPRTRHPAPRGPGFSCRRGRSSGSRMAGRLTVGLRFGVLGTGYWAAETHAAGIAAHESAELVGVWGRDPAKAEALGRRFGVRGYGDLDALLEVVDAVAVAVPPDVQADLAVRAAAAGRHLLLDKPLALSLEQARAVVDAAEANHVASVIFFTARFVPEVVVWLEGVRETGGWEGAQGIWFGS